MADELGGAVGGAASGASAGSMLGPIGAIGGGLVGGAIGLFTAKKRAAEAKRLAALNNNLAFNDTAFGGFNKGLNTGHHVGDVSDSGPSALGGALQGGLAGVQQGMNIYDGMRKMKQPLGASPGLTLGTPQAVSDNSQNAYGMLRGLVGT